MIENRHFYKRYNTQSDKKCLRKRLQQSVEQINNDQQYSVNNTFLHSQNNQFIHTTENYFLQDSSSQGNDFFAQQINLSQEIKSRYMTCYNENEDNMFPNQQYLSSKVRSLMKGLKQLIKELCLTKNSNNQVQEELQKLIVQFQDTAKTPSNKYFERNNNPRQLSCLSQIRVRTIYQIQEPSFNTLSDNEPYSQGLKLFHPFLSGTSFQSQQSQIQTRLTSFQQQLLSEFLQKYLTLLQKQINRISRYNGQKKLKYLLSTVMKQIFTQIMRFTYETKISMAKKQTNNLLNNFQLKINLFVSTVQRMLNTKSLIYEAFSRIKNSIKIQQKADIKLINKFESKINYLDNLLKFRERTDLRQKFLKWRKNTTVIKETQRIYVMEGIRNLVKEILYEFALNEGNLERWKFIVWSRLNMFIKSICNVGECVLFPVDQELLQKDEQSLGSSVITSNRDYQSRITSNNYRNNFSQQSSNSHSPCPQSNSSDTFRFSQFSPNQQQEQNYLIQKRLLDEVHETFSLQEIKECLQNGQIIMHDVDMFKLILIPLKSVGGIIVVKYQLNNNRMQNNNRSNHKKKQIVISQQKSSFMNVNSFYNILNALQLSSPVILELITLKQKFQYFQSRIQEKSHHKFILNHLLSSSTQKVTHITQKLSLDFNKNERNKNKNETKISQFISIEDNQPIQITQNINSCRLSHQEIDNLLMKMNVTKVNMYHRKDKIYFTCLNYNVNSQSKEEENIIGKDIIQAIFTQLQKINKNILNGTQSQSKCLYLKKSSISFYACPIIEQSQLVGFVEMHLDKDFSLQTKIPTNNIQNTFIVKTVDSKSQILNQTIIFVNDVVVPMIMKLKMQQKLNVSEKENECLICQQSFNINQKMLTNMKSSQKQEQKNKNSLSLTDINNLFIKITSSLNSSENRFYEIEKIFLHQIEKYHISLLPISVIRQQENSLTNQQFFTKIFYLTTLRTKDNKIISIKKQKNENLTQDTFWHTNFNSPNHQKVIKLPFIDMLKLFNNKSKIQQFEQQTIQIGISKLNEIYKSMLRKMRSQKLSQTNNNLVQQGKQNNLQTFIEQIIKSTLLKSEILPLQDDKKYHALELWLYQLQHMNKKYGNDKSCFRVSVFPIFSILDSKNKYLSGIVCSAGVILNNQDISQRKINSRNSTLNNINEFTFKLSQQILGRIFEIQIKKQSLTNKVDAKKDQSKKSFQQNKFLSQQIKIDLKKLTNVQETKLKMYNKSQTQIHTIISSILGLQHQIKNSQKTKTKNVIMQKFYLNLKLKKYKIINRFVSVIQNKVIHKNLTTKSNLFSQFFIKLNHQSIMKSQHYMINTLRFVQKMSNVFIRNKMLNTFFVKLKHLTYQSPSQVINKLFQPELYITKKFALQRISNILFNKIYNKNSKQSLVYQSFNLLKDKSKYQSEISSYQKQISVMKLNSTLQKLLCNKTYLPYFNNLSQLEKSLYQSISLIGTQIQTINFYSIHQFLTFISQRISIIINSEKRLIQILYGQSIEIVKVQIIVQNQQTKKFEILSISEQQNNELSFQQVKQKLKYSPIFMMQIDMKKFYIYLDLKESQTQQKNAFEDLRKLIQNIFLNQVSFVFNKFMILYSKKIDTFVLKLSKFLKIPVHFRKKNVQKQQNQDIQFKKQGLKILMQNLIKSERMKKIEDLTSQVQLKSKQLTKLHDFYQKRTKKLTNSQLNPDNNEINMSQITNDEFYQNVVSKKSIKQLRKNIQNLDMSNQNLSIQYQIKSKTVAGYQMMEIINTRQRKQAMREVFSNLSMIMNEESNTNLCSTNTFFLSSIRKQILWSDTSRKLPQPIVEDVILEEKQKLNYSKVSYQEQKNLNDHKFKKAGIKSMTKVLNNICQSTFSKTFYRINSFSWVNSPKLVR